MKKYEKILELVCQEWRTLCCYKPILAIVIASIFLTSCGENIAYHHFEYEGSVLQLEKAELEVKVSPICISDNGERFETVTCGRKSKLIVTYSNTEPVLPQLVLSIEGENITTDLVSTRRSDTGFFITWVTDEFQTKNRPMTVKLNLKDDELIPMEMRIEPKPYKEASGNKFLMAMTSV